MILRQGEDDEDIDLEPICLNFNNLKVAFYGNLYPSLWFYLKRTYSINQFGLFE